MLDGWNARSEQARSRNQQQAETIADGMTSAPGQDPAAALSNASQDAPRDALTPKKRPRPSLKMPNSAGTNKKRANVRFADTADIRIIYQASRKETMFGTSDRAASPPFVAITESAAAACICQPKG